MKKINIIKKNDEFTRIIKNNRSFKSKYFIIYVEKNEEEIYHFGLSVGKKVGNAVTRNKEKRRIKSILDKFIFKKGFNCIIIVKREIVDKSFKEMEEDLIFAIKILDIIKESKDEEKKY